MINNRNLHAAADSSSVYEMEVAELVNKFRAENGLAPLKILPQLQISADIRAKELCKYFSHTRPDGTGCETAVTVNWNAYGENIAAGQMTPEIVMNSWENSAGHRANMLGDYEYIGVGCYYSGGVYYWTQIFISTFDEQPNAYYPGESRKVSSGTVGDVNGDGYINSKDAVIVLKYYANVLAGKSAAIDLSKADMNNDGKADSIDATYILVYYANSLV